MILFFLCFANKVSLFSISSYSLNKYSNRSSSLPPLVRESAHVPYSILIPALLSRCTIYSSLSPRWCASSLAFLTIALPLPKLSLISHPTTPNSRIKISLNSNRNRFGFNFDFAIGTPAGARVRSRSLFNSHPSTLISLYNLFKFKPLY